MKTAMRRIATALLVFVLAACGGGSSSSSNEGFSVSFDRSSVEISFEQGQYVSAIVNATGHGTPDSTVYVGATTPNGRPDPNIDHVSVSVSGSNARISILPTSTLPLGTYRGTLVLLACRDELCSRHYPGSPFNVAYTITVRDNIRVTPRDVVLSGEGSLSLQQTVQVVLPPDASGYTVTAEAGWAAIDQQTADSFRVSVSPRPAGTYETQLTLRSGNYVRRMLVRHVALPREFRLSAAEVELTAVSGNVALANLGVVQLPEGESRISADTNTEWLHVSNITPGGLQLQADSMPSGTHLGQVTVVSGIRRISVPVRYVVSAPPGGERSLSSAPNSLTFAVNEGALSATQAVTVTPPSWNPAVTVEPRNTPWLSVTPVSATRFDVQVNAAGLLRGTYTGRLGVRGAYPSTERTVTVSVTVGPGLATPAAQTIALGSDSSTAALTGSVPVRTTGATALQWTASSSAAWLRLTRAQGTLGQDASFEIDTTTALQFPPFTDQVATVTLSAPGFTAVQARVTARREIAELHFTGPGHITAGKATRVIVRGRGFSNIADPAARLSLAGATPLSITRLSDSALAVELPALAAGRYDLSVSNRLGVPASGAALQVVAEQTYAEALVPTTGVPRSLLHDPVRQTLYAANQTLSAVQRFRFQQGTWVTDSLSIPSLLDIGLSPDGATLVVADTTGRMHLVDTTTFTAGEVYTAPGVFARTSGSGPGLAVTNDGRVWLGMGTGFNELVTFDLRSRTFIRGGIPGEPSFPRYYYGPWFALSRNGERMLMVQSTGLSPQPPLLHLDASEGVLRPAPNGTGLFYTDTSLGDTGDRVLMSGDVVYDRSFARIGTINRYPEVRWSLHSATLSPDGRKVYSYGLGVWNEPNSPLATMPRIYVFDASGTPGAQAELPTLGQFELSAYPTCRERDVGVCMRPIVKASADGKTLFVLGSAGLAVIPLPVSYTGLAANRRSAAMKLWMTPQTGQNRR